MADQNSVRRSRVLPESGDDSTITGSPDQAWPNGAIGPREHPARVPVSGPFVPFRRVAEIRVWAPIADAVTVTVEHTGDPGSRTTLPLIPDPVETGWWLIPDGTVPDALAELTDLRYGFGIDGGDPLPDPRSVWQPDGVHGLSALHITDPTGWHDADWAGCDARGAVIYELHVGTFTPDGTLDSAITRLDHLVRLGIDLVELMPVNAFNGTHNWGYDGVDWYAVHEAYGGPAALQRFVDACHGCGLGVVLDVVYNHLGPSGNYLPRFGPYLTEGHNTWGASVNLDEADSDPVRRFIIENALRWFSEFHVDALRLDAVHALVDRRAVPLLEELAIAADRLSAEIGRPLSLIAESDLNDPRLICARGDGGHGLAAQWNDDMHHAVHAAVSGERQGYYADFGSLACLAKVLRGGFFHDGTYSSFRRRRHGRPVPVSIVGADRLLAYTCDHDQIGNRATGDRPSDYLDHGSLAVKAALVLMSPFTPMLFMGEEWAAQTPFRFFTSHPEPELAQATADGRRAEFAGHGWATEDVPDPQDPRTFTASKLDWSEPDRPEQRRMLEFYRRLIALRKTEPDLRRGDFGSVAVDHDETAGWLRMIRGEWEILCILGPEPVRIASAIDPVLWWSTPEVTDGWLRSAGHNVVIGRRTDGP